MNPPVDLLLKYVKQSYADQALQGLKSRQFLINQLLEKAKWPTDGWDEATIEMFLQTLSAMDSNNFLNSVSAGEREARIISSIVSRRHMRMGHGIGRSGDLTEIQPKAIGSSIMNQITNKLALDVLRTTGVRNTKSCFVTPTATGMSLVLCFLTLRHERPKAKYILWPRIDQKSCFKSIMTAGFEPIIIENKICGDALVTDVELISRIIDEKGSESILCIFSTTSCFAPRHPDDLLGISKLCHVKSVPHVVNNAYGVQSSKCMHMIQEASDDSKGFRIDVFVQSTDKNFLVPVGGSIIAGFNESFVSKISSMYPGRGSSTPSMDLLVTLLNLGVSGYSKLLQERKSQLEYLKTQLKTITESFGERILLTKDNTISVGITLDTLPSDLRTKLGSMLFIRGVSGARVVNVSDGSDNNPSLNKIISGYQFKNWGSHSNTYPHSYLTVAASIGMTKSDVDTFIRKFSSVMSSLKSNGVPKSLNGLSLNGDTHQTDGDDDVNTNCD